MGAVATRPTAKATSKMRTKCDDCIALAIRGGFFRCGVPASAAKKEKGSETRKESDLFFCGGRDVICAGFQNG